MLSDEEKELLNRLHPDNRPLPETIEAAYTAFGAKKNGDKPSIRFRFCKRNDPGAPNMTHLMQIIVDEVLTLWFYFNDGKWVFDGYEAGNYSDYWKDHNLPEETA